MVALCTPSARRLVALLVGLGSVSPLALASACGSDGDSPTLSAPDASHDPDSASSTPEPAPAVDASTDSATPPIDIVPVADATAPFGAGSRLRIRIQTDGSRRVFKSFVDPEYGPCTPQSDPQGVLRCLPTQSMLSPRTIYTDASCTDELWIDTFPPCDVSSDAGFVTVDAGTCPGCKAVRAMSAPIRGGTGGAMYERANGSCVRSSMVAVDGLRRLGAALDPEAFVRFESVRFGEGRLHVDGVRGSDGSFLHYGTLFDETEQQACSLQSDRDGATRCLPAVPYGTTFAEADCTTSPVIVLTTPEAPPVVGSMNASSDTCGSWRMRLFAPGPAYSGPLYYGSPSYCTAQGAAGPNTFAMGAEIDPARYVALNAEYAGADRLQRPVTRGTDASPYASATNTTLYDNALQTECQPALERDGQLRCIPTRFEHDRQFLDASCTQRAFAPRQCGEQPLVSYMQEGLSGSCTPRRLHVARVGAAADFAESYSLDANENCVAVGARRLQPILVELAPSELQPMIEFVE